MEGRQQSLLEFKMEVSDYLATALFEFLSNKTPDEWTATLQYLQENLGRDFADRVRSLLDGPNGAYYRHAHPPLLPHPSNSHSPSRYGILSFVEFLPTQQPTTQPPSPSAQHFRLASPSSGKSPKIFRKTERGPVLVEKENAQEDENGAHSEGILASFVPTPFAANAMREYFAVYGFQIADSFLRLQDGSDPIGMIAVEGGASTPLIMVCHSFLQLITSHS